MYSRAAFYVGESHLTSPHAPKVQRCVVYAMHSIQMCCVPVVYMVSLVVVQIA